MAKSRVQINADSDKKRGVKTKGFKLHLDTIALIEQIAKENNISQAELIKQSVELFVQKNKSE